MKRLVFIGCWILVLNCAASWEQPRKNAESARIDPRALRVDPRVLHQLSGQVTNEENQPINGAIVRAGSPTELPREVLTDRAGCFLFPSLSSGAWKVEVSAAGFVTTSQAVSLDDSSPAPRLAIRMPRSRRLEAVKGAEEKNPNQFISKIDLNAMRDLLRRNVIDPEFLEMDATEALFGAEFGTPLRRLFLAKPSGREKQLHGALFWSHENSALNARPFFNAGPLRPSRRNQFGVSLGAPVTQAISLSGHLELVRESGFVNGNVRVPLPEERTPQSGDPITDRIIGALLKGYPDEDPNLPAVLARQLNTNALRRITSTDASIRTDVELGQRQNLAARYVMSDSAEDPFELVAGENPKTELRPQSFSISDTLDWSPATHLVVSTYFDRLRALLLPTDRFRSLLAPIGLADVPDIDFGGDFADLSPLGPGSQFPRRRYQNRFGGFVALGKSVGRNDLRLGGSVLRVQTNDLQSNNTRGKFVFSNNFGRTAIENFLHGTPSKFTVAVGDLYRGFRHSEYSLYLSDNRRLGRSLSLTLGVRYEVVTAPIEVNGLTSVPFQSDRNNWAPTLGFSWAPAGNAFVVRAGYGISFSHIFPATYQMARFNPPQVQTISIQNPSLSNPLEGIDLSANVKKSELLLLSPDLVSPYAHQYNLLIQKQLGSTFVQAGYVGNRTVKLFFPYVTNRAVPVPGIPATTATIDQRRPDPRFLSIQTIINSGMLYYDGLKVGVQQRMKRMGLDINYIFSKALTSGYEFYNTLNAEKSMPLSQNNQDFQADLKSPSELDARHSFTCNLNYEVGQFHSKGVGQLLSDWRLTVSTKYRTGNWFNMSTSSDAPGFGNVDGEGDDRPNVLEPRILGSLVDDPDTCSSVFNPIYFNTDIAPGGRGNIGLRVFRKDALNSTNLSFSRRFALTESRSVRWRTDIYNFFNHPQFQRPGDVFPSPTFGKIVDTQNKGRVIQSTIEVSF